jgi:hypothetical protein
VFGRKQEQRSHRQQLMDELMESYGHLKLAAGHVAGGTAEKLTPTYDRAQDAANRRWSTTLDAFMPLYEQMRDGAANARKGHEVHQKKRWPVLVGLLAAGTAVGAAGAVIARRRRAAAQWDEYDPMPAVTGSPYGADPHAGHKVAAGAASVADSVSSNAGKIADSLHDRSGVKDDGGRLTGMAESKAADAADKVSDKAKDAADKHKH